MCRIFQFFIIVTLFSSCAAFPQPDFAPKQKFLKVVTYNVNLSGSGTPLVAKYLQDEDADVVFLQETNDEWKVYLSEQLGTRYTYAYFHSSRGAGGIAFLSKYPLRDLKVIQPNAGWFPALRATVDTEIGELQLLNVHLRPPLSDNAAVTMSAYYNSPEIHRGELDGFLQYIDSNKELIVAGDFNEHENKKGVSFLTGKGYTDALSMYDRNSKTWRWKVASGIEVSNRYDHVVYSRHLCCTGAKVTRVGASDHEPVTAVLTRKESN